MVGEYFVHAGAWVGGSAQLVSPIRAALPECQSLRLLPRFFAAHIATSQRASQQATARRRVEQVTPAWQVVYLSMTGSQEWFACWFGNKHKQIDRTDGLYQVLGGTVLVAPFHGNTDQDTQRIDMSEPQQHTPSAPAAARREKPKYRGGAGADHVRPTSTPAPTRLNLNTRVYLINANGRPISGPFVIRETNATVDRYRVERPDGQPVRDPRVREGWVERRYLRTEQSVIDENARRQRADEERRAVEQQAEQQRRDQEVKGWKKWCRQLLDDAKRKFG